MTNNTRAELLDQYGRADTAPLGTMSELKQKLDAYRSEVLREAADAVGKLRQFGAAYGARKSAQVSENVGILAAAAKLRELADEAGVHDHTWVTALDGADEPARDAGGNTWMHCGVCGLPKAQIDGAR